MKNLLSKLLAFSLPVILAFSIQECSSRNTPQEPETTAYEQKVSSYVVYDPDDPNNPANQTTEEYTGGDPDGETGQTEDADSPTENPDNPAAAVPTDKAGIIAYYNTALGKTTGLKRTSYTRTLTLCKVGFPVGDKTNDSKVQNLVSINDTSAAENDLGGLEESFVKSASSRVDGSNVIFDINLNDKTSDDNIQKGDGGFAGIVTFAETAELVKNIAKEALGLSTELKSGATYNLTAGKYTVIINKDTGNIASVSFSCTEGGAGKVSITSIELSIDIKAEYKS